jgi:multicomponent K+:H+ antiporter subunit E
VRRPLALVRYIGAVAHDVLVSSFEVAWGVLAWRWRPAHSRFVVIPLELRDPVGLAVLAVVTTIVPGTVWSELALDRSRVMLHVWDVTEDEAFIRRYKARYEQPLQEIFE